MTVVMGEGSRDSKQKGYLGFNYVMMIMGVIMMMIMAVIMIVMQ